MLKDFIQAIKDKLESEPRLHAVLIYGSQANSSASPSSDIDIAYLADYEKSCSSFFK
jgi:predicted nucleotidyltransferase